MRILIVEDSEDIQILLTQVLEVEDHELFFADNGKAAVELAQAQSPDFIFMDMSLPIMTGWEAVRVLRSMALFKDLPIVALTAHASKKDEEKALEAGCTSFISKPFDMNTILDCLDRFRVS